MSRHKGPTLIVRTCALDGCETTFTVQAGARRRYCDQPCTRLGRSRTRRIKREAVQHGARDDLTASEIARFYSKLAPPPTGDACRVWTGGDIHPAGYGQFAYYVNGKRLRLLAHRVAYTLAGNALSPDEVLRHSCDNPPCVNVAHLTPGTQADNIRDAIARGRMDVSGLDAYRAERDLAAQDALERGVRTCSACREELPLESFHRSQSHPGGRTYTCRPCDAKRSQRRAAARRAQRRAAA